MQAAKYSNLGRVSLLALLTGALITVWSGLPLYAADGGAAAEAEAWRKSPPAPVSPRPFKMPPVEAYNLSNGLKVELVEDHRVPFITVQLGIRAGSTLEPQELTGLSSLTADMLTEGTSTSTSKQIAQEVDNIGGGLKASSDYDFTLITGSSLSRYTDRFMGVMSDVLLNPTFPEDELTLNKTNLLQSLVMKRSQPDFLVEERFNKVLFGSHPYSVVAPSPDNVKRITRADLKQFHDQHYLPNESVLIVVGDFDSAKMKDLISRDFGSRWKPGQMPVAQMPALPQPKGRRIFLVDRPGSVQSSIKVGNVGIKKTDPDYFPLLVANQVLGGSAHARLFMNIREKKGYTYGAYSGFAARKQPGAFNAEADVRSDVTAPALKEFIFELERIAADKVDEKELASAKTYLAGTFQLGLETQIGLVQRLMESQLYDLPANYLETYTDNIMAVTPDEIQRVAGKHIDTKDLTVVVVGDANKVKSGLQAYGPVEVYESSGKLKQPSTAAAGGQQQ